MRTFWQRLRSPGTLAVIGLVAGAVVTITLVAAWVWWRHDERPWPVTAFFAAKALLMSKGVFKIGALVALGVVIAARAVHRRVRGHRNDQEISV